MSKNSKFSTRQIAYIGIFVGIGVMINSIRMEGVLSLGGLPIILSGYALGPGLGFIVGILTDIVAFIVRPSSTGGINPIFAITSGLTALIPVLVTRLLGDKYPKYSYWKIVVGILVGQFITSVFITPFFVDLLYLPGSFWIKMPKAAIMQTIKAPIYGFLVKVIIEATTKTINFRKLK